MTDELDPNSSDYAAQAIQQLGTLIPGAGPVVANLFGHVIPRQRIDRIVEHVRRINLHLKTLDARLDVFERHARTECGTALLEESTIQAARAVEPERRDRIAALIVRALTKDDLQYEQTQKLLRLYESLTYPEIIWLVYYEYKKRSISGETKSGEVFNERYKALIESAKKPRQRYIGRRPRGLARFHIGMDDETALNQSYIDALVRLSLLSETENSIMIRYQITDLGSLLAREIELRCDTTVAEKTQNVRDTETS